MGTVYHWTECQVPSRDAVGDLAWKAGEPGGSSRSHIGDRKGHAVIRSQPKRGIAGQQEGDRPGDRHQPKKGDDEEFPIAGAGNAIERPGFPNQVRQTPEAESQAAD